MCLRFFNECIYHHTYGYALVLPKQAKLQATLVAPPTRPEGSDQYDYSDLLNVCLHPIVQTRLL